MPLFKPRTYQTPQVAPDSGYTPAVVPGMQSSQQNSPYYMQHPNPSFGPGDYNQRFYNANPTWPGGPQYQQGPMTPGTGMYSAWAAPITNGNQPSMGIPPGYNYDPTTNYYRYDAGAYHAYYNPSNGMFSANSGGPNTELGQYNWQPLMGAALQATGSGDGAAS